MRVDVYACPEDARVEDLAGKVVLVIDILRATSVMATALRNGAASIWPVLTPEEGQGLARAWGAETALLGGERGGVKLPGFDLGNSPAEYGSEAVGGRRLIATTTNGTRAIRHAAPVAAAVGALSFLNVGAVAEALLRKGEDVAVLCAGTDGRYDACDSACAGALIARLGAERPVAVNDLGLASEALWLLHRDRLAAFFAETAHGRRLVELGFASDLEACAAVDSVPLVPWLQGDHLAI